MPIPWKVLGGTAATGVAGTGLFFVYLTHGIETVPMQASDTIFHSQFHAAYNPNGNPTIHDLHVIRVPLHRIEPGLLEDQEKLLERFCGGVWAGIGKEDRSLPYPRWLRQSYVPNQISCLDNE
jgi:hypothetical protein